MPEDNLNHDDFGGGESEIVNDPTPQASGDGEPPFRLHHLKIGAPDMRGKLVLDIFWRVDDFAIYRTTTGVSCQFSDEGARAQQQHALYSRMTSGISEFNQLVDKLTVPFPMLRRVGERFFGLGTRPPRMILYEREYARCIAQALFSLDLADEEARIIAETDAGQAFERLRLRLSSRVSDRGRVWHLFINMFLVTTVAAAAYYFAAPGGLSSIMDTAANGGQSGKVREGLTTKFHFEKNELALAMMMGSFGALFSTASRLKSMDVDPTISEFMHVVYATQRVLVGVLGAVVIYFGVRSGILNGLFQPLDGDIKDTSAIDAYWLSFVCILAGFSERFVPNLLDSKVDEATTENGK